MKAFEIASIISIYLALLVISVVVIWGVSPMPEDAGEFAGLLTVAAAVPSALTTAAVTLYVAYFTATTTRKNKCREDEFEILVEAHGALLSYFRALDELQVGRLDPDQVEYSKGRLKKVEEKLRVYAPAVVLRYFYKIWQECTYIAERSETLDLSGQKDLWCTCKKKLAKKLDVFREDYARRISESERFT